MHASPIVLALVLAFAPAGCAARKASSPPSNVPTSSTPANAPTASGAAHACVGSWNEPKSNSRLLLAGPRGSASCGRMEYPSCSGELERCTWTADGLNAHYRCVGEDETYTGTLAITCTGDSSTVVDDTDGHDVYTDTFVRI
jgi:hypothetical protein